MAKTEPKLGDIRKDIDALDEQLFELLQKRASLAGRAGEIKRNQNDKEFAKLDREAQVRKRAIAARGVLSEESMDAIYREIISGCLALEQPQNVCYLGPEYTFTHEAAQKHFGDTAEYTPAATVSEAVSMTEKEVCNFTVVPFENSNGGTVGETFDVLAESDLQICGEITLRIRHNLLAKREVALKSIDTIYAHPQAFEQCRDWLLNYTPQAKRVALASNSAAAAKTAVEPWGKVNPLPRQTLPPSAGATSKPMTRDEALTAGMPSFEDLSPTNRPTAAIASLSAAKHYKLEVIKKDIEDSAFNTTRFLMLGRTSPRPSGDDKTSIIMAAHHESGALYHLLEPFKRLEINLSKFESRPARGKLGEYLFFVDIDGHQEEKKVAEALNEIYKRASFLKILGSYPKAVA